MEEKVLSGWGNLLRRRLPLLGHRNWIVVADGAYPWQAVPGMETVATEAPLGNGLKIVLQGLVAKPHLRPVIHVDVELPFLSEEDTSGISSHRAELQEILKSRFLQHKFHKKIIRRLDVDGHIFRILLLKTTLTLPYASVHRAGLWLLA